MWHQVGTCKTVRKIAIDVKCESVDYYLRMHTHLVTPLFSFSMQVPSGQSCSSTFCSSSLQHLSITEESVILTFWMKTTGIASFPDPCSLFSWTVVYVKGRAIGNREMLSGGKEGGIILNSVLDSNNCCTKIVRQFTFNAGMWLINRRSCLYFEN